MIVNFNKTAINLDQCRYIHYFDGDTDKKKSFLKFVFGTKDRTGHEGAICLFADEADRAYHWLKAQGIIMKGPF